MITYSMEVYNISGSSRLLYQQSDKLLEALRSDMQVVVKCLKKVALECIDSGSVGSEYD